ncbi:MAG: lysylphosphatidylglycerol synthase domain-containing protein [Candidatus Nitrosoglobus sp.]|jgi:hypothetical protein
MKEHLLGWLKALAAPRRALVVLISLILLAAVLGLSDIPSVLERGHFLRYSTVLLTPVFAAIYLALKGWQFGQLLAASGLKTRWRSRWLAFAIGEISLTLPFGVYSENYILQKTQGIHFADSAASTTVMLALEVVFLVVILAVVAIPGWPQVRFIMWGGIVICVLLAILARGSHRLRRAARRRADRDNWVGIVARGLLDFLRRLSSIGRPYVLLHNAFITAIYMLALMSAFYCIGSDVSFISLSFSEAITIYSFGLLIAMSLGSLLSQFGVLELSGATAAQAWGLGLQDGLAILLWFRLLWTVSIWIISGSIVIALWKELHQLTAKSR